MSVLNELSRAAGHKAGAGWRILRKDGTRGLMQRFARVAYEKLQADALELPLLPEDIADSTNIQLPSPSIRPKRGEQLVIGWVSTPPSLGSGGHTTMFRMVQAIEAAGHRCVLFLYDRYGGDIRRHEQTIRQGWPEIQVKVVDATSGIDGVDACIATGWPTAHVLARRGTAPMRRLYFIQDYEPFFYPRGSEYSLAEDTYRFGFRCIALGRMVGESIVSEVGLSPDVTQFGCDTSTYRFTNDGHRSGVVFYTRPGVPRRGYLLGRLALEDFHRHHPEQEIHVYGHDVTGLPFPVTRHKRMTPLELNELYNSTVAGLAMSFTNISLVAEEMLAAGTIPVVNDSRHSRADIMSEYVEWAPPTPAGIARSLSRAVERVALSGHAQRAAESVRRDDWRPAQNDVVRIVENEVFGGGDVR